MKRFNRLANNSSSSAGLEVKPDFSGLKTLYGREKAVDTLEEVLAAASSRKGVSTQVVFIHGPTGTGKKALCRFVFQNKGNSVLYLEGKFDQLAQEPYSGLSQAFAGLPKLLARKRPRELAKIQSTYRFEQDPSLQMISNIRNDTQELGEDMSDHMNDESLSILPPVIMEQRAKSLSVRRESLPQFGYKKCIPVSALSKRNISIESNDGNKSIFSIESSFTTRTTAGSLFSIIPDLESFLPTSIETNDNSVDRSKHSFRSLLRATCSPSQPLVLCLTGVQWADYASLQVIQYLAHHSKCMGLIILLCYRDDESLNPTVENSIKQIKRRRSVKSIRLENLTRADIHAMIADVTLTSYDLSKTLPLSDLVYLKTNGNPFFAIQYFSMLPTESLWMNYMKHEFEFDIDKIRVETYVADNVADLLTCKLNSLPESTQEALRVAACLGSHCYFNVIATVLNVNVEEVKRRLGYAANDLLIDILDDRTFKWAHDKIQHSAYMLLPEGSDRFEFRLKVGRALKNLSNAVERDWILFFAVENLNFSAHLISQPSEKTDLINLNMRAAEIALEKSALTSASEYLNVALNLMGDVGSRWKYHYETTLKVSAGLADVECSLGRFQSCDDLTYHILKYAKTHEDRFPAYFLQVESLSAQGSEVQALDLGVSTIQKLGFAIPCQHLRMRAIIELFHTLKKLKHISDQTILQLQDTENLNVTAAMEMMSKSIDRAFSTGQNDLALLIAIRGVKLTLYHGKHGTSCHFFAFLGVVCSNKGDWENAKRFGDLSLSMAEQQECLRFTTNPQLLYFVYLQHLQNPLQQALDPILSNYRISMNAGNIDDSHTCIANYVAMYIAVGLPLAPIQDDAKKFVEQLSSYNRSRSLALLRIFWQFLLCLIGKSEDPLVLTGEAMDQESMVKELSANNQFLSLRALWTSRMMLAYHFGDLSTAQTMISQLMKLGLMKGHFVTPILHGFGTFIYVELARLSSPKKKVFFARKAAHHIRELNNLLKAKNMNAHHIYHLCLAEQLSIQSNVRIDDVIDKYRRALSSASRSGILHFAAVGNERAGIFLSRKGFPDRALQYHQRAIELYSYWGAHAKVEQMKNSYNLSIRDENLNQSSEGFLSRKKFTSEEADRHVSGMFKRYDVDRL